MAIATSSLLLLRESALSSNCPSASRMPGMDNLYCSLGHNHPQLCDDPSTALLASVCFAMWHNPSSDYAEGGLIG